MLLVFKTTDGKVDDRTFRRVVRDKNGEPIRTLMFPANKAVAVSRRDLPAVQNDIHKALLPCEVTATGDIRILAPLIEPNSDPDEKGTILDGHWVIVELSIASRRLVDLLHEFLEAVGRGLPLQPIKHRIESAADAVILTFCGDSRGQREDEVKEAAHRARLVALQFPALTDSPISVKHLVTELSALVQEISDYSTPYPQAKAALPSVEPANTKQSKGHWWKLIGFKVPAKFLHNVEGHGNNYIEGTLAALGAALRRDGLEKTKRPLQESLKKQDDLGNVIVTESECPGMYRAYCSTADMLRSAFGRIEKASKKYPSKLSRAVQR